MASQPKAPEVQKIEQTSTNLPAYAEPYVTDVMQRAQALQSQPYQTYEGQRTAQMSPDQVAANQGIMGLQTPEGITVGQQLAGAAGLGALTNPAYTPTAFTAQGATAGSAGTGSMAMPDKFSQAQADYYMSPYFQSVLDVQKRDALLDAKKAQLVEDLGAARQGTYGGSRQLLAGMERERNLGNLLADIQAKGLQSAFENAQSQFERDRAARQLAQKSNLDAMTQTGIANANYATQAAIANQQANLEAQRLAEQSKQFGSNQGLASLAQANQSAQTMGNLGALEQQANLQNLTAQQNTGKSETALDQQILDQQYQDFLKQQAYPMEQLQAYSNIVHGNTIQPGQTSTIYGPAPSTTAQVVGTGLGALGMYNSLAG